MKKSHLAKRRLRFEGLEARLTLSAVAGPNAAAAIPVRPPAVTAPLSGAQAAIDAGNATSGPVTNPLGKHWAGVEVYDAADAPGGNAMQAIQATWIVPRVTNDTTYTGVAANWVGIGGGYLSRYGGTTESNLVQLGTQETVVPNVVNPQGAHPVDYTAWWEVAGGPDTTNPTIQNPLGFETPIPTMIIHPGDLMHAEVAPLPGVGNFRLSMTDLSDLARPGASAAGATFVKYLSGETGVVLAGDPRTSAEVVTIEAVLVNGVASPLPQLSPVFASQALLAGVCANIPLPNLWMPIGSAPGFEIDDIISTNPSNPLGQSTETFAFPGLATITTFWISST